MPEFRFLARHAAIAAGLALLFAVPASANRFVQHQFQQIGARHLATGGGHVAMVDGTSGAYWNPASISWYPYLEFVMEGVYHTGPTLETSGGANNLRFEDEGSFGMVGVTIPGERGFHFSLIEVQRYNHDIRGTLFDTPEDRAAGGTITSYEDRVSINSFGVITSYRSTYRTSVGIGVWFDRKKVFKSLDYTAGCDATGEPPTDQQIADGFLDAEASTNNATAIRFSLGGFFRATPNLDLGASIFTNSNMKSTLRSDVWFTCAHSDEDREVEDETPLIIQVGALWRRSPTLRLVGDLSFTRWSIFDDAEKKLNYSDMAQISLGTEWDRGAAWTFRGGLYSQFDASDLGGSDEYAAALRDLENSGNPVERNELYLTVGVGYLWRGQFRIDASLADSHLASPEDGQTTGRFAIRVFTEPSGS